MDKNRPPTLKSLGYWYCTKCGFSYNSRSRTTCQSCGEFRLSLSSPTNK